MFKITQLLPLLCLAFLACKNDPKTESAPVAPKAPAPKTAAAAPNGSTAFILTEGVVNWTSKYATGKKGHQGTIGITSGELWVSQGKILSGNAILDMNSISVPEIKDSDDRLSLESHLKDSDFFEANKFRTAEFMFMEVSPSTLPNINGVLNGELTMKGITAPVKIPFKVSIEGDVLRAESANFSINRTNWGVNFKSGILGTAKDQMIDDMVSINLKVVAKKK